MQKCLCGSVLCSTFNYPKFMPAICSKNVEATKDGESCGMLKTFHRETGLLLTGDSIMIVYKRGILKRLSCSKAKMGKKLHGQTVQQFLNNLSQCTTASNCKQKKLLGL